MTFVEACELLTEILVGKKKPVSRKKVNRRPLTNKTNSKRRYTRKKK